MLKVARNISILTILILIFTACNLPKSAPATEQPNAVFTAAALTVQAQLTQSVPFNAPTIPPPAATNTSAPPTIPASPLPPAASATPVCDQVAFVRDVNYPDGSQLAPGATFTKTWRLRNAGVCTWSNYSLVFEKGDLMGATSPQTIPMVSPNQEADLSVNFTAPTTPGSYRSYWRVRNTAGVLIPGSFYVDIKVATASSGFDFYTRATGDTAWSNGSATLTFGGPDTNAGGFVMYRDGQKLEDGTTPSKVLETHPQWVDNGVITGLYSSYTVVSGEHFKAKLGFIALSDGTCGAGSAKFQLNYKTSGASGFNNLGEWIDNCDGALKNVDVDLSSLATKTVQFQLAVSANGSAGQDWAVWVAPQIAIP